MISKNTAFYCIFCSICFLLTGCGGGSTNPPPPLPPPARGEITITLTGVPDDVVADVLLVQVLDPISNVWDVPKSQIFANMEPGSYSVLAETFSKSLTEFILTTERRINFEVAAGEMIEIQVDYSTRDILPGTLNLTIDKSLVQNGVTIPPFLIEDLEGFSQSFTEGGVVTDLVPGTYYITALDFVAQPQNYGFYFDHFVFSISEDEITDNNLIITPVPARIKSIELLPEVTISGIPDGQGNFYTLENQPQINRFGVARHFIHKWDSQGIKIRSSEITGQTYGFWSWKLAVDDSGNVYLAGFEDTGNLVGIQIQNLQAQIYKYNSSGQLLWEQVLPQMFGLEYAKVNRVGVQNNKMVVFATREPLQGNVLGPREALLSVVNTSDGAILNTIPDSTINDFTQLIPIQNQGYWVFATDKIVHYSIDGLILESNFTGNGVEPFGREITGGVAYQPDPLGGFFVLTTIDGPDDSDIQLTKYDDNFNVIWQQVITNFGREIIEKISYDSTSGKILIQFFTEGNFANMSGDFVISEWDSSGQKIWLRQYTGILGFATSVSKEPNNIDWKMNFDVAMPNLKRQFGTGNSIVIGQ